MSFLNLFLIFFIANGIMLSSLQAMLPSSSFLSEIPNNRIVLIPSLISSSHNTKTLSTERRYCPGNDLISSLIFIPSQIKIG